MGWEDSKQQMSRDEGQTGLAHLSMSCKTTSRGLRHPALRLSRCRRTPPDSNGTIAALVGGMIKPFPGHLLRTQFAPVKDKLRFSVYDNDQSGHDFNGRISESSAIIRWSSGIRGFGGRDCRMFGPCICQTRNELATDGVPSLGMRRFCFYDC